MKRIEVDIATGQKVEITVLAYKNADNQVFLLDEGVPPPKGYMQITDQEAAELTKPAPVIPTEVRMRQARLALFDAGLLDTVDESIALMPDAEQRRKAQIEWEFAATVQRDSDLVRGLAVALNLSDEMLDQLFTKAATL